MGHLLLEDMHYSHARFCLRSFEHSQHLQRHEHGLRNNQSAALQKLKNSFLGPFPSCVFIVTINLNFTSSGHVSSSPNFTKISLFTHIRFRTFSNAQPTRFKTFHTVVFC